MKIITKAHQKRVRNQEIQMSRAHKKGSNKLTIKNKSKKK